MVRFSAGAVGLCTVLAITLPAAGESASYVGGNGLVTFFPATLSAERDENVGGARFYFQGASRVDVTVTATDGPDPGFSADFYTAQGEYLGSARGCGKRESIGVPLEARELTVLVGAAWSALLDCPSAGAAGEVVVTFR
ncbi:MAG TPA: hypothetical protein VNZ52_07345 [Candidatus Thermoplasmatota archaeon]|nr:hypothetical protein [Candidatus Thermoplasmatota archaeon]